MTYMLGLPDETALEQDRQAYLGIKREVTKVVEWCRSVNLDPLIAAYVLREAAVIYPHENGIRAPFHIGSYDKGRI